MDNFPYDLLTKLFVHRAHQSSHLLNQGFLPRSGPQAYREYMATAPDETCWSNPADDDRMIGWTRDLFDALTPHATGGVYSNYLDRDEKAGTASAFGPNFERLQSVKREYDPDGVFADL